VPAGSELTIEAETHEVTAFSGIRGTSGFPMGFICRLAYNGKQLSGILSEFIQSHKEVLTETPNQVIDETIAERLNTKTSDASAFAVPTELTAILADPINIDLKWKDNAKDEAGYFVEYSPYANESFVIIEALGPNTTTFRHANLMPQTKFLYRVRPFFGVASNIAEVTTGKAGPQQAPSKSRADSGMAKTVPSAAAGIKKSI